MNKFDRIYDLVAFLRARRYPVPISRIAEELECSEPTVKRIISKLRHELDAPIIYDKRLRGYVLQKVGGDFYELPGLWFNTSELYSLLASYHILEQTEPGILGKKLESLRNKIKALLASHN